MTGPRRYHPLYAVSFLRKTLLLYLLPLVQVLIQRDWEALRTALGQDLALFGALTALSVLILRASRWELREDGVLVLQWSFLTQRRRVIRSDTLAVLEVQRPLTARLTGASQVILHPAAQGQGGAVSLWLRRRDGDLLAQALMPAPVEREYQPRGRDQLALVLLGANSLSTLLLIFLALQEGRAYTPSAELRALAQLNQAAAWVARWLPETLAWILTALAFLFGLSVARSFGRIARYRVWKGQGVAASQGGLFRRVELRVRLSALDCADLRLSPAARLLRRYPVYLTAGCYQGAEIPFLIWRPGQEALLEELVPGLRLPPVRLDSLRGRSLIFFLPAGLPFALFGLLTLVSRQVMPELTAVLALPTLCFFFGLLGALEGFLREGAWPWGPSLTFLRQKGVRLHWVCLFGPPAGMILTQSPWAVNDRRANLKLVLPGGFHWKVRSIPLHDALACARFLEG